MRWPYNIAGFRFHALGAVAGAALLGGCAGPLPTISGADALAGQPITTVARARGLSVTDAQWALVQARLAQRGMTVQADSPYALTVTLTERPAAIEIIGAGSAVLAPAKADRLFQSCKDSTFRLVLSVADQRTREIVGRGWAEESHCRGTMADALPRLVEDAASMLTQPRANASQLHWRRD